MEQTSWSSHEERSHWFATMVKGTTDPNQIDATKPDIIDHSSFINFVMKYGVPDDKRALRSLTWKLLLNYLPFDRSRWQSTVILKRKQYDMWVKEFVVNPYADLDKNLDPKKNNPKKTSSTSSSTSPSDNTNNRPGKVEGWILVEPEDDPLSLMAALQMGPPIAPEAPQPQSPAQLAATNKWIQYYQDEDIRLEIDKDIQRTYSSLHFFQKPVNPEDDYYFQMNIPTTTNNNNSNNSNGVNNENGDNNGSNGTIQPQKSLKSDLFGVRDKPSKNKQTQGLFNTNIDATTEGDIKYSDVSNKVEETTSQSTSLTIQKRPFCHSDSLSRILFLYAKLNPGVRYVQGMNEILAPIYHVFASDPDHLTINKGRSLRAKQLLEGKLKNEKNHENQHNGDNLQTSLNNDENIDINNIQDFSDAEADSFFVFSSLMSEIRDRYIKSLDSSEHGILTIVQRSNMLLHDVDYELWKYLQDTGLDPRFYSFRWITLLLSQDFELPDLLRLWDSIFADPVRFIDSQMENSINNMNQNNQLVVSSPLSSSHGPGLSAHTVPDSPSSTNTIPSSPQQNNNTSSPHSNNSTSHPTSSPPPPTTSPNTRMNSTQAAAEQKQRIMAELKPTDPNFRFELYVCCAMLIHLRDELLGCDFTECLFKIHHYPEEKREIDRIISLAIKLRQQHLYQIYEANNQSKTSKILSKAGNSIGNLIDRVKDSGSGDNNNSNNSNNNHSSSNLNNRPQIQRTASVQQNNNGNNTTNSKEKSNVDSFLNWLKK